MSSSGGGLNRVPSKTLQELQKEREEKENEANYNREVNEFLNSLLNKLNNRDTEQIGKHLDTIREALEKDETGIDIEGYFDLRYGGSVSKHTYSNGLSDIDMLVNISGSDLASSKPSEILNALAKRIERRLPKTEVKVGDLAVTIEFTSGHEVQLLPSIKTTTGNKIPKPGLNEWSNVIKPQKFAEKLTAVNQDNGGKVIPLIKLYKNINATLPKSKQLSGYHIESLAIDAFKNPTSSSKTYKAMLSQFCKHAEKAVLKPIQDSTGQSVHVDGYLKSSNSLERKQISQNLKMIEKKINQADSTNSISMWKDIFGTK